jgi:deoxyribodipyrimidine photo-lyase
MAPPAVLVWFRHDLRLSDNPALAAAVAQRAALVPVFIWSPQEEGAWPPGAASRWWLAGSLASLSSELEKRGSRLLVRQGPAAEVLKSLARETGALAAFWNRRYESQAVAAERRVESGLREMNVRAESFNGSLLFEPGSVLNKGGQPFRVFTPFWQTCSAKPVAPLSKEAPRRLLSPLHWPGSLKISDLGLEPDFDWAGGLREAWSPGEAGAARQLQRFVSETLTGYTLNRDRPDLAGTSRLSPHLHFGEISPGAVWRSVLDATQKHPLAGQSYLRQLAWREFAAHVLHFRPESPEAPLRPEFRGFPWKRDPQRLRAWQRGKTGYPLVDAGMRELWRTGWMHNRVRMVAASFLVKHLLISWREGAAWFWDTLVDADLANNTFGWQWVAGCGADAAPYFRIFNPAVQAAKFDPSGDYQRRWAPESAPGRTGYPSPVVNHAEARVRALAALARMNAG